MHNRLTIARAERSHRDLGGGAYQTGRVFADLVVDGQPLSGVAGRRGDLVSVLGWGTHASQDSVVARLLGDAPAPLPDGRQPLYVCAECGDVECGALTVVIEKSGNEIVWRDFDYETGMDIDPPDLDRPAFADVGPFRFARADYEAAIRSGFGLNASGSATSADRP